MTRPIPIAVRDFALPAPRTGSIEVHSGYGSTTEQGVEIHVALQAERSQQIGGYQAEVPLAHVFTIGKLSFRVGGRIDGIVPGQPTVFTIPATAYTTALHFDVPAGTVIVCGDVSVGGANFSRPALPVAMVS